MYCDGKGILLSGFFPLIAMIKSVIEDVCQEYLSLDQSTAVKDTVYHALNLLITYYETVSKELII